MSATNGGYTGPPEIRYLFVDGASLTGRMANISKKYFGDKPFVFDFHKLKGDYTRVFYYDALPVHEDGETDAAYQARTKTKQDALAAASDVDGIHVYEGEARRRKRRGLEQKKVDVKIAVDMLTHTFRRNMHQATLLTGDLDFLPLVEALVREGMFVRLWYPYGETSRELKAAADAREALTMETLRDLLHPSCAPDFPFPVAVRGLGGVQSIVDNGMGRIPPVAEWRQQGVRHSLYSDGAQGVVVRHYEGHRSLRHPDWDDLVVRHPNFAFLCAYCEECLGIRVPEGHEAAVVSAPTPSYSPP